MDNKLGKVIMEPNKYTEVVYGSREKTTYPAKLIKRLFWTYYYHPKFCNERALDLGCGDLTFTKELENYFEKVHGLEFDFRYFSKLDINGNRISTRLGKKTDFNTKLPYKDNSFDFILCKSVIEHIWETEKFLKEILRILKPGGRLLILTPCWEHNYKDFYNDFTHIKPFHRKGLQDALKISGFNKVNVEYFYHLPWLWDRPAMLPVAKFLSLFSKWKWKDKEETKHRVNIRFSQEIQLLGLAEK